jgi:hypothetical protein
MTGLRCYAESQLNQSKKTGIEQVTCVVVYFVDFTSPRAHHSTPRTNSF